MLAMLGLTALVADAICCAGSDSPRSSHEAAYGQGHSRECRRLRNGRDGGGRRDVSACIRVKTGSFPHRSPATCGRAPICAPPGPTRVPAAPPRLIGTALGWSTVATIVLAVALAFVFGYSFTIVPVLRSGLALKAALGVALAADTVSITVMEIVDNVIMVGIPGAM